MECTVCVCGWVVEWLSGRLTVLGLALSLALVSRQVVETYKTCFSLAWLAARGEPVPGSARPALPVVPPSDMAEAVAYQARAAKRDCIVIHMELFGGWYPLAPGSTSSDFRKSPKPPLKPYQVLLCTAVCCGGTCGGGAVG